jgi:predicted secreted hydrolase
VRRAALLAGFALALGAAAAPAPYPDVRPGATLAFPADEGAHPDYRTEWWYVTGWLETADGTPLGFQVTFFRTRPRADDANPSRFAARQVLIAHAALSDARVHHALHAERIAREGFGLAASAVGATRVTLGDWRLVASGAAFEARVEDPAFGLELGLARAVAPVANGAQGYSQKGPAAGSASWYYSIPRLAVRGVVRRDGRREAVTGEAWLDHEWSSAFLDAESEGWDWIGLNLADGGSLMAFRIRDAAGAARWAGGTLRRADGRVLVLGPGDVEFAPGRRWRSPRTGISFPVEWRVRAGPLAFALAPLMDDQESDSRLTTGAVYWEGAVRATGASGPLGRGYLELTGYGEPLRLR